MLRRTTLRLPRKRYGTRIELAAGERETDAYDAETEEWAIQAFPEFELVIDDESTSEDDSDDSPSIPPDQARDDESDRRDERSDRGGLSIEEEAARVVTEMDSEDAQ